MDSKLVVPPGSSGRIRKSAQAAATFLFAGLLTPALFAAGLNGNLSLSSVGTSTIAVNGSMIDFDYTGGITAGFPPIASGPIDGNGDSGLFDITAASTLSFVPVIGSQVTVHDLNSTSQPTGATSGPGLPLTGFITFSTKPLWNITLTEVLPGVDGSADCTNPTGVHCTPAGSPFNLDNEGGNQVLVGFSFLGTATDGTSTSNVAGTFSTTFSNTSYQQMLVDLNNGQAIVSSPTATIGVTTIPPVPEPGSMSLLFIGTGLLGVSAVYRRKHQRP